MKFIGLEPISSKPQIEIIRNGHIWDLHNVADFIGYLYDLDNSTLQLSWDYGCECDGIIGGEISLKFHEVTNAIISAVDADLPRSEDRCLEAISLTNKNTVLAEFRGGQSFDVSCGYVVFDPNGTNGSPQI